MITESDINEHIRDLADACPECGALPGRCSCIDDEDEVDNDNPDIHPVCRP